MTFYIANMLMINMVLMSDVEVTYMLQDKFWTQFFK